MQLAGQTLALLEGGLAAGLGEEAGVLDDHGGLIRDGPEKDLFVLAGLLPGKVGEVDPTS